VFVKVKQSLYETGTGKPFSMTAGQFKDYKKNLIFSNFFAGPCSPVKEKD
jgi:hypothetical protein